MLNRHQPAFYCRLYFCFYGRQNKELEEKTIQLEDSRHQLAMDVAQRKKTEEKYRFLAENMADIVWTLDKQLNPTYLSPSIEKVLGFTADQLMQSSLPEMITPESWQRVLELSDREFKRDAKPDADPDRSISLEVEYYKKDGTTIWMEDTVKAIRDTAGALTGFYGVSHDIAARKEAERQRLELERHALKAQKAESLGRSAGAIAHLFNNKLSVVQGNLELSIVDSPDRGGPRENLIEAFEASEQAAEISGLMLSYLGLGAGKCERLDLSGELRQNIPLLQNNVPDGIVLESELMSDGPVVHANAKQLWQILNQLLNNAREAIGSDPGKITLTTGTIAVSDIPKADLSPGDWEHAAEIFACIEVTDTGCGIAAGDMDKIFDPFFTTKFTGRGLGLAVTLGFVKAWGGAISLESRPGRGSVARVYLPLAPEGGPRQAEAQTTATQKPAEGNLVLLVDDQENVRHTGKKMLNFLGYNALTASCGSEALELFRLNHDAVCCVITDLSMPDMDGWQTLAALRAIHPELPVILSSGYDEAEVMITESPHQPHAFLQKPYSLKALRQKLHRVLEGTT